MDRDLLFALSEVYTRLLMREKAAEIEKMIQRRLFILYTSGKMTKLQLADFFKASEYHIDLWIEKMKQCDVTA